MEMKAGIALSSRFVRVFLAVAFLGATGLLLGKDAYAAVQYTVLVGGGSAGISDEEFRPGTIFIHSGDSIRFLNPYEEIHTVTFAPDGKLPEFITPAGPPSAGGPPKIIVNPQVSNPAPAPVPSGIRFDGTSFANSGVMAKNDAWTVSFQKQGNFTFVCVIHPGMDVTVSVVDAAVKADTQEALDAAAATKLAQAVANGQLAAAQAKPTKTANADGSSTWQVLNVPSAGQADVMQFLPPKLQIAAGDTVSWNNPTLVPHTVTFLGGTPAPELITPEFGAAGPPTLVLNPKVLFPTPPSKTYEGAGYVNSGFIGAGPEATAGKTFSLTFTKPGTYTYLCVLHADLGMTGVIEVGAAGSGSTIKPPSTGDAGLAGSSHLLTQVLLGLGGFTVAVAALAITARVRGAAD
jgi:plastocyanin